MNKKRYSDEFVESVIMGFFDGLTCKEIAKKNDCSVGRVSNCIRFLKDNDVLPEKRPPTDSKQREPVVRRKPGTIKCNQCVAKKCIYGTGQGLEQSGLCNYILITGHMRGCPPESCDKYTEGKKLTVKGMEW